MFGESAVSPVVMSELKVSEIVGTTGPGVGWGG